MVNWNDVSWVFNYKETSGLLYDFFNPYQKYATLTAIESPATAQNTDYYSLTIPSITLSTPVIIGTSADKGALEEDLDRGAVYYPGSVLPKEQGQIIILGHSAPPNWPRIKHDYIFSDIEDLNNGDIIFLNFKGVQYSYKVMGKKIVEPGQEVGIEKLSGTNNILTLVSCWPPGENRQRIAVTAEFMEN